MHMSSLIGRYKLIQYFGIVKEVSKMFVNVCNHCMFSRVCVIDEHRWVLMQHIAEALRSESAMVVGISNTGFMR